MTTDVSEPEIKPIGDVLQRARKAKSMTLQSAAERLKLTEAQLHTFESSEMELTKLDPFQRGYLRNYAELLEVDLSPYALYFPEGKYVSSQLASVQDQEQMRPPLMASRFVKWLATLAVLFIIAGLIFINQ